MRFGPTSIQVSSVLSKGLRRPKLRSDLRISEQTVNGEKSYVIKNHETNSYNRYGEFEYQLLMLCDGTRTPAEISEALSEQDPDSAIAESEVLEFLDSIEPAMWERSLGEKNLAVLERIRDERKGRVDQSSMLYIAFKAWDPNKTLDEARSHPELDVHRSVRICLACFLFITATYFVAGDWSASSTRHFIALFVCRQERLRRVVLLVAASPAGRDSRIRPRAYLQALWRRRSPDGLPVDLSHAGVLYGHH